MLVKDINPAGDGISGSTFLYPPNVPAAVVELRRAVTELGMLGAMLPSNGLKGNLGSKEYWPVYAMADNMAFGVIQAAEAASGRDGIVVAPGTESGVRTRDLDVALPDGTALLDHVDCELVPGSNVLVSGPSGIGKSTLFRALAGIWPFGHGVVRVPEGARVLFLPQKPYLIIGTLREQLSYPDTPGTYPDDSLKRALDDCGLKKADIDGLLTMPALVQQ